MDGADDLAAVDALEVDAGDAKIGVAKLALDHDEWNAFVRHLDCVSVSQLMRREPSSHSRRVGRVVQLLARGRRLPAASRGRSVDHAQHRADRELATDLEPRLESLLIPTSE